MTPKRKYKQPLSDPWLAFPVGDFYSARKGPRPRPLFINPFGLFRGVMGHLAVLFF